MIMPALPKAYEEIVGFFASGPSREEIIDFKLSAPTIQRMRSLLRKNSAGTLDPTEVEELDHCIHLDRVLMLIRSRAMGQARESLQLH